MISINGQEIASAFRAKKLSPGQEYEIQCERVSAIRNKDILESLLLLSRLKNWRWVDSQGNILPRASLLLETLPSLIRDFFLWPVLYWQTYGTVQRLGDNTGKRTLLHNRRVLLFLRTDHWYNVISGGSVGHISGVIQGFQKAGYRTYIVSTDKLVRIPEIDVELCSPKYEVGRNIPNFPEILYSQKLISFIDTMWQKWSPAFVYQRYSLGNFSGVLLKNKHQIPYICEYNGSFIWMAKHWDKRKYFHEGLLNKIELLNLHAADLVVVVSKTMKDDLAQRGIASDKILVNPNGVDPERYSPEVDGSPIRHRYGLGNKTVIGFIGTFGPWHGAEVLVEAFGCLLQEYPEYRGRLKLLMIGDGVTRPQVDAAISGYNLADDCILTGLVSQDQGPIHLAACDILASPHVPNPDGTPFFGSPTKLFEYMAMGKGIVASDLDQIGEVLRHNETAWMVKPGNAMSLMLGLKALADDEELRRSLGQAARQEVLAHYTWQAHTQRILDEIHSRCG